MCMHICKSILLYKCERDATHFSIAEAIALKYRNAQLKSKITFYQQDKDERWEYEDEEEKSKTDYINI